MCAFIPSANSKTKYKYLRSSVYRCLLRLFTSTTLSALLLYLMTFPARANIFTPAEQALRCVIGGTTTGGLNNAVISKLPSIIFNSITVIIFIYVIINGVQIFQAVRQGEEVTQLMVPFMTILFGIGIILIFQQALFSGVSC